MLKYTAAGGGETPYECTHIRCTHYSDRIIVTFVPVGKRKRKPVNLKVTAAGEEVLWCDAQGRESHIRWDGSKATEVPAPEELDNEGEDSSEFPSDAAVLADGLRISRDDDESDSSTDDAGYVSNAVWLSSEKGEGNEV
jgi:hypothetical protein